MNHIKRLTRIAAFLCFAVWWGGFTFYALVVVPTGHRVLHSKVRQGFITQQVTVKLNTIGVAALVLLACEIAFTRPAARAKAPWRTMLACWAVLCATLIALMILHPHLDALLDATKHEVIDDDRFYSLHRWYLIVATLQWFSGLGYVAAALQLRAETE
jgi:hypothetical protein